MPLEWSSDPQVVLAGTSGNVVRSVTAGNALIVQLIQTVNTKRDYTVSDGVNTWATVIEQEHSGAARVDGVYAAYDCAGGSTTITVTASGTATFAFRVHEVSGLGASPTVVTGFAEDGSAVTSHHCAASGSIDTSGAALLVLCGAANGGLGTITAASGFTAVATTINGTLQYKDSASAETDQRGTWTSGTARDCINVIVAFEYVATVVDVSVTIPADWLSDIETAAAVPFDWLVGVERELTVPTDWLIAVESSVDLPSDWLEQVEQSITAPADWLGDVESAVTIPADWLGGVTLTVILPVDWISDQVYVAVATWTARERASVWVAAARPWVFVGSESECVWVAIPGR